MSRTKRYRNWLVWWLQQKRKERNATTSLPDYILAALTYLDGDTYDDGGTTYLQDKSGQGNDFEVVSGTSWDDYVLNAPDDATLKAADTDNILYEVGGTAKDVTVSDFATMFGPRFFWTPESGLVVYSSDQDDATSAAIIKFLGGYYYSVADYDDVFADYKVGAVPTKFVDSVNGSDSNDGTTPYKAYASISKLITEGVSENDVVGLLSGSVFREDCSFPDNVSWMDNVTIATVGYGNRVEVTGYEIADTSGAVQDDAVTYPNVYRFNCPNTETAYAEWVGLAVDGVILNRTMVTGTGNSLEPGTKYATEAECLAHVNSNEGSLYYSYASSEHRYYVNVGSNPTTDSKVYEYKLREYVLRAGEYLTCQGILVSGAMARNGAPSDNQYKGRVFNDTVFEHGGIHNMLQGGKLFERCESINSPDGGNGFHANAPFDGQVGLAYVDCVSNIGGGASLCFYNHDNVQPFISLVDCEGIRQGVEGEVTGGFFNYENDSVDPDGELYMIGCSCNARSFKKLGGVGNFPSADTYIEDSLFYAYNGSPLSMNYAKNVRIRNSRFLMANSSNAIFKGSVTDLDIIFDYCTIIVDHRNVSYAPFSNDSFMALSGTGSVTFNNCLFVVLGDYGNYPPRFGGCGSLTLSMSNCQGYYDGWNSTNIATFDYDSNDALENDPVVAGDWSRSATSPAEANDIGWKENRETLYRADAEALVASLR